MHFMLWIILLTGFSNKLYIYVLFYTFWKLKYKCFKLLHCKGWEIQNIIQNNSSYFAAFMLTCFRLMKDCYTFWTQNNCHEFFLHLMMFVRIKFIYARVFVGFSKIPWKFHKFCWNLLKFRIKTKFPDFSSTLFTKDLQVSYLLFVIS